MGTRSLTKIYDDDVPLVCMYRQYDGYPSGHGVELAEFLKGLEITNGIRHSEPRRTANGAGCLAAQLVTALKKGPGNIYLFPVDTFDADQEYEYRIRVDGADIHITVLDGSHRTLFNGDVNEFTTYCHQE